MHRVDVWSGSNGRRVAVVAIALTLLGCGSDADTSNATEPGSAATSPVSAASVTAPASVADSTTGVTVVATHAVDTTITPTDTAPVADRSDWNVCANRFAFETLWIALGRDQFDGAREELLALGPQPGLDDAWQAMLRSLDEGTDPLDNIGPVLDYYRAVQPSPCDPKGLPEGFGCDLVDDCAATLVSDTAARATVASPLVILNLKDPAEVSECGTADAGGQQCFVTQDSGSTQVTVTFTQTTEGRYFVGDLHK